MDLQAVRTHPAFAIMAIWSRTHRCGTVWSSKSLVRTGREYCLHSEQLHLPSSGLGTCCPPGAQTVIWLQNWGSAPHCGSLKGCFQLTYMQRDTRNRGNTRQGRREGQSWAPGCRSHLWRPQESPAGAMHSNLPTRPQNACGCGTWKLPGQRHLLYAP